MRTNGLMTFFGIMAGMGGVPLAVMAAAQAMNAVLMTLTPSRESSLAITKLEECAMWANKSVAFNSQ